MKMFIVFLRKNEAKMPFALSETICEKKFTFASENSHKTTLLEYLHSQGMNDTVNHFAQTFENFFWQIEFNLFKQGMAEFLVQKYLILL